MTTQEALRFLEAHQPMPDDEVLTEELIGQYDDVRNHFIEEPDSACIPLFLNSFGSGDGFGVYQLVEDVMAQFTADTVVPYLVQGLSSASRSVRYWNAEIAASFPCRELVPGLAALLDESDEDLNAAAVIALGQISTPEARAVLQAAQRGGLSEHVAGLIDDDLEE